MILQVGGGNFKYFFLEIFTPILGEDEAILTIIFSNGLKPPTRRLLKGGTKIWVINIPLKTNISPVLKALLKMIFLFARWDMVVPCTISGQTMATSHDLGPQKVAKEGKWDPLFQENPGW